MTAGQSIVLNLVQRELQRELRPANRIRWPKRGRPGRPHAYIIKMENPEIRNQINAELPPNYDEAALNETQKEVRCQSLRRY